MNFPDEITTFEDLVVLHKQALVSGLIIRNNSCELVFQDPDQGNDAVWLWDDYVVAYYEWQEDRLRRMPIANRGDILMLLMLQTPVGDYPDKWWWSGFPRSA